MTGDRRAVERLLGGPDTAWLVDRVRGRVLAAEGRPLTGVVVLAEPTAEQRTAIARLIGSRGRGRSLRVDLAAVEDVLRRGPWPAGLADAVQTLTGPVVDRAAARRDDAAAWEWIRRRMDPVIERCPGVAAWWEASWAAGAVKRAAQSEMRRRALTDVHEAGVVLVDTIVDVFAELPADGEPLSVLARRIVGDAHGLDQSRTLGRFAAAAVAAGFAADGDRSVREVWAAAGVLQSASASTVLALGLRGAAGVDDPVGAATAVALDAMRGAATPIVLTLDQIRSGGIAAAPRDAVVHVCENPAVVDVAADGLRRCPGSAVPILVCTSGQPTAAVTDLMRALARDGAQVRYHGDFDWAGLTIARVVAAKAPWTPWRFGAADYRAALVADRPALPLSGATTDSPWDPDLAVAMAQAGLAVEEEAVIDLLVADLLS